MTRILLASALLATSSGLVQLHAAQGYQHTLNLLIKDALESIDGLTKNDLEKALSALPLSEMFLVVIQGDKIIPELLLKHIVMPYYTQSIEQYRKDAAKSLWEQIARKELTEDEINRLWNSYYYIEI